MVRRSLVKYVNAGMPLSLCRTLSVSFLTPLRASFRSKSTRVITLPLSHAWSTVLGMASNGCSVFGAVYMSVVTNTFYDQVTHCTLLTLNTGRDKSFWLR
jgi:hypothetical protein